MTRKPTFPVPPPPRNRRIDNSELVSLLEKYLHQQLADEKNQETTRPYYAIILSDEQGQKITISLRMDIFSKRNPRIWNSNSTTYLEQIKQVLGSLIDEAIPEAKEGYIYAAEAANGITTSTEDAGYLIITFSTDKATQYKRNNLDTTVKLFSNDRGR